MTIAKLENTDLKETFRFDVLHTVLDGNVKCYEVATVTRHGVIVADAYGKYCVGILLDELPDRKLGNTRPTIPSAFCGLQWDIFNCLQSHIEHLFYLVLVTSYTDMGRQGI
jgi:hypothetical protein